MQRFFALSFVAAAALSACGSDGTDTASATTDDPIRTIEVVMTDNAYSPATLTARPGESIRFVFRNDGTVRHEAVFGTLDDQLEHHDEMADMAGHDMDDDATDDMDGHDMDDGAESHAVVVEPGAAIETTHTFDEAGLVVIGCHEPGHWEAGMRLDIDVT